MTASKTLKDGIYSYDPANIHDGRKDTVWAVGDEHYGIGTKLTFTFDCSQVSDHPDNPLGIDSFSLINGLPRSQQLWVANSRVKSFKISFNGRSQGNVTVADTAAPQILRLPKLTFTPRKKNHLTLEIVEVYPGATRDTCVADIAFDGFGVH